MCRKRENGDNEMFDSMDSFLVEEHRESQTVNTSATNEFLAINEIVIQNSIKEVDTRD